MHDGWQSSYWDDARDGQQCFILEPTSRGEEPLTTVIGIKTSDGLVLCSDSQLGSGDLVDLEGTKLFKLNDYAAIGCAGDIAEAQMLIEELQIELKDELLDHRELRKRVENVLLKFYNEYAVGWSKRLGIWPKIVNFYNPISLLAVRLPQNRFALYRLTLTSKPSMAEINNYEAIGTGDKLSNLVLRQYRIQSWIPHSL